jgi:hypothetical protein
VDRARDDSAGAAAGRTPSSSTSSAAPPRGDLYYVQPAEGRRAAWVNNVGAHPTSPRASAPRRMRVHVRDATGAEGAAVSAALSPRPPVYARVIVWFVGYVDRIDRPDAELLSKLADTPVFAIEVMRARAIAIGLGGCHRSRAGR